MEQNRQNYEIVDLDSDIPVFMRLHPRGRTNNPRLVNNHWHRSIELVVTWEDFWLYYINGREFSLTKNTVCLVNSMDIHRVEPQSEVADSRIVAFTLIISYDFVKTLVPDIDEIFFRLEQPEEIAKVQSLLYRTAEIYYKKESIYWKAGVMEQVCSLICYLCSSCRYDRSILPVHWQKNTEQIRELIEYIQEHYAEDLPQQGLAERFYFSREYLSRLFKKYTNYTIKEYLIRYRLMQAELLLTGSSQSVLEIALAVGFNGSKQFIQAFKKYYNTTPLQFRKSCAALAQQ